MSNTINDPAADLNDEFDDEFDAEDLSMFDVDSDAYKQATSNCMVPAADAVTKTYGGRTFSSWDEILQIISTKWEKKEYNGALPGDRAFMITIVLAVDAESTHVANGDEIIVSPNCGRRHFERLNFNLTALGRDPSSGHGKMTKMSFEAFKSLTTALGMTDRVVASNNNIVRFFADNAEELPGMKVAAQIQQGPDKQGNDQDQVRRFSQWPEDEDE